MCCMSATPAPIGLRGDRLALPDHRPCARGRPAPAARNILFRALGVETEVRLDYATQPVALHDRFLLCSDGVHGSLTPEAIADILRERSASEDTARALVAAALDAGCSRQLHRLGARRGRAADGGIGRVSAPPSCNCR